MKRPEITYLPGPFGALASTELGKDLWTFLNKVTTVERLDTATDLGNPAVSGIEGKLLEQFEEKVLDDRVKQMIGHMVRQVMEAEGYEIDKQNVTISSALFSKGTRYRRSDWERLNVFRNSKNPKRLCFSATRKIETLPKNDDGSKWRFWSSFATTLRGCIVFGIDVHEVREEVKMKGFAIRELKRVLRA